MSTDVVELQFPAEARYLVLARLSLTGVAQTTPRIDAEALTELKLATTEACSNAVRHAYPNAAGEIRVRIELSADQLSVEVSDRGSGFDQARVRDWHAASMHEQGMGLSIIRSVTDELQVGSGADGVGTTVRFAKNLTD